ncbi:hsp90-like protein [Xylaria sp. CBS 124048]|nr:hsp90-like protein [Xylaria sp. CBS 124048]
MPTPNSPTIPSQPCDYCPPCYHDEAAASTPEDDETPFALEFNRPHRHLRPSPQHEIPDLHHHSVTTSTLEPAAAAAADAADAAEDYVLHLRGGGHSGSDAGIEPPSPAAKSRVSGGEDAGHLNILASGMRPGTRGKNAGGGETSAATLATQQSIKDYRAKLARDLERKAPGSPREGLDNAHMSPVQEDLSGSSNPTSSTPTTSNETIKTGRGSIIPGGTTGSTSYPFPRMSASGPRTPRLRKHMPTAHSQTGTLGSSGSHLGDRVFHDQPTSDSSTPASAMSFLPPGYSVSSENADYPDPNLYELSLMLSAEPGLDGWWNTVVQIMTKFYLAERITLSVPADATDIDNVPWGQKATYNYQTADDLSMGYMARGSSLTADSSDCTTGNSSTLGSAHRNESPIRPSIQSRHSFTTYEEKKKPSRARYNETLASSTPHRPGLASRSRSYYSGVEDSDLSVPHTVLSQQALKKHGEAEEKQTLANCETPIESETACKGHVLPVLQALDLEADPLIDNYGVSRVIDRGKVIALTRTYPYFGSNADEQSLKAKYSRSSSQDARTKSSIEQRRSGSSTNLSSFLANASAPFVRGTNKKQITPDRSRYSHLYSEIDDDLPRPPTPRYEEFEQAPPSPWSQSPAPSPAVRSEPPENPFFTNTILDGHSFDPGPSPYDYTSVQAPETIGIDNSWTVLHIPLNHILLSRSPQRFKLDSSVLKQRTNLRSKHADGTSPSSLPGEASRRNRQPPIAILSILSPVIPYPPNLRRSLDYLGPHLATSFSLCRHYSNLETEVMGLSRKRPSNIGFGAIGPDGKPAANPSTVSQYSLPPEDISQRSVPGSLTSPSEYSTQSRSIAGSPTGTPFWEPGSFGLVVERRTAENSPGSAGGDSYFNAKIRGSAHAETTSGTSIHRVSLNSKDIATITRQHRRSASFRKPSQEPVLAQEPDSFEIITGASVTVEDDTSTFLTGQRNVSKDSTFLGKKEETHGTPNADHSRRPTGVLGTKQNNHKHTRLHSYGGDFAATLQSLPPNTPLLTKPTTAAPVWSGSVSTTAQVSMSPPTDRLKSLMLDLVPVQIFVAWPMTGEIVWVNSRYLTYRGQTLADLVADPWASFHEEDREDYLRAWTHSLRTGDQFVHTVRLRRFDGAYRWHQARAVASRDKRGVIVQFIGSYMDIHDEKVAKLMALRQADIEESEAKHRLLANLIPQIIFTATERDGITFSNEQWMAYTGQSEDAPLGNGFMDFVHPDDLAKCCIPIDRSSKTMMDERNADVDSSVGTSSTGYPGTSDSQSQTSSTSRDQSATSEDKAPSLANADISELAKKGIIKIATDSNGRLSYSTELRLRSKTGEYRWHLIRCVEIDDVGFGSGSSSYFGSATDINDHKLLEETLKEAMESKGRFLSNMSHEIRTPLIGISGMVSLLQDTTLSEEQRDFTNTIQTSANGLLMIINDILDLSKVDAGMMKLKFEWFHTRSLIEDVHELVFTMAIAKRLELNYLVEENVPAWVKGDKFRIRQVLLNVIGNAIKFTSEGEVFSRCRVYMDSTSELEENQIMLEFSVIDTGRGFTKEEAALIFKPFSQIDGSCTRQHGGSGLGLVISRQLVELHGGQMEGSAIPGKGSIFTFTARFGLPSATDHPGITNTATMTATARPQEEDKTMQAIRPLLLQKTLEKSTDADVNLDVKFTSALELSTSSDSARAGHADSAAIHSSMSPADVDLVQFSEAAKASGQDLTQMKFRVPIDTPTPTPSPPMAPTPDNACTQADSQQSQPAMYSILIVCPQQYSREAITRHIETTLPRDAPYQIATSTHISEAQSLIGGHDTVPFTHVVLNLASADEILTITTQVAASSGGKTMTLIMSDSVQRHAVLELASGSGYQQLLVNKQIIFVHKPVKPSRFAVIFDPARERDVSTDLNRSSAARMVESQKQSYLDVERRVGDKGVKVLLVEDNPVNQKVLCRYLKKIGVVVEIAGDGVEATEKFFARSPKYYSLILCDLHMPRKDGYQTCRDIRQWEHDNAYDSTPIIALSANVMSDVHVKCVAAGFNDFVMKPVDFINLSTAISKYF